MSVNQSRDFTFVATGDSIITRDLLAYEDYSTRFDNMLALLREADAAFTNLEVLVHDYQSPPAGNSGGTYMRAQPSVLDTLSGMGFSLFATATNHTGDYGQGGVTQTIRELETRNLTFAGIGRNRHEARTPAYLETSAGRVGLVSGSTSMTPGSEAGVQTDALQGRAGLNPIRVERIYSLHEQRINQLRQLSDAAGIERMKESWLERGLYIGHDWNDNDYFHFGDMKFVPSSEENEGISYEIDDSDRDDFTRWVSEADATADWVVASIHSHQGFEGRQNTPETPQFLIKLAHDCVNSGADIVVCHGPHVLRGIELYEGKPIFYSLGNYIVQNETVSRLPAESFERYDLDTEATVTDIFNKRLLDDSGEAIGDLANDAFWKTVIPVCSFNHNKLTKIELYPCSLQRQQPKPQRGIPILADSQAQSIIQDLSDLSEEFGTEINIENGIGVISMN